MKFVPLHLTHLVESGEEIPPSLGWKDLGALRILEVTHDNQGKVQMKLGYNGTRAVLVATKEGFSVKPDDSESVTCEAA